MAGTGQSPSAVESVTVQLSLTSYSILHPVHLLKFHSTRYTLLLVLKHEREVRGCSLSWVVWMYETRKDVKLVNEGLMRLAGASLCPVYPLVEGFIASWSRRRKGRERERETKKKKKSMNYFLSIYSVSRSIIWGVLFRGASLLRGRGAEAWSSPLSLFFARNCGSSTEAGQPSHQEASF